MSQSSRPSKLGKCVACGCKLKSGPTCEVCGKYNADADESRARKAQSKTKLMRDLWRIRANLLFVQAMAFILSFFCIGNVWLRAAFVVPLGFVGVLIYYLANTPSNKKPRLREQWQQETWYTAGQLVLSLVLAGLYGAMLAWFHRAQDF